MEGDVEERRNRKININIAKPESTSASESKLGGLNECHVPTASNAKVGIGPHSVHVGREAGCCARITSMQRHHAWLPAGVELESILDSCMVNHSMNS